MRHATWLAAETALGRLPEDDRPDNQTGNGSGFISRDFKILLSKKGVAHHRIRPHTPTDNGVVERVEGTIKTEGGYHDVEQYGEAVEVLGAIVEWCNHRRLHSEINFLPPWILNRGDPQAALEERSRKIAEARHRRRELNLQRRQATLYVGPSMSAQRGPESSESQQAGLSHFG